VNLALLIPNSTPFIALSDYAVKNISKYFASIIVIAHKTATPSEDFRKRVKKAGFLNTIDEFSYCMLESWFGMWDCAVYQNKLPYFPSINLIPITSLKSDDLANVLEHNRSDILIGVGCSYVMVDRIPQRVFPINIHPGILPTYRGLGNPEALIRRDFNNMGLTIHRMSKQIDCGQILLKRRIPLIKRLSIPASYILSYKTGIRLISKALGNRSHHIPTINSEISKNNLWRMPLSKYLISKIF